MGYVTGDDRRQPSLLSPVIDDYVKNERRREGEFAQALTTPDAKAVNRQTGSSTAA